MSDDLERRLRVALHDAPLPGAPATLRAALLTVPDAPPDRPRPSRWQRLPLALAAVLVLAVVGLAGVGLLGKLHVGPVSPSSGNGLPTEPPAPPTSVQVLDATQLAAAIAAQRAGGLEPQVVVTSVSIDSSRRPGPSPRECGQPTGSCVVIGVLDGLEDWNGAVTIRMPGEGSGDLPTPTEPSDLAGPVALRLVGTSPIEFLGHVDLHGASGIADVASVLAATATAPAGKVWAVDGWLVGVNAPSCGPVTITFIPKPAPFACPSSRSLLTATPVKPVQPMGENGAQVNVPDEAVPVQAFAYDAFAPAPVTDGLNVVPRRALYLVRMVAVDTAECQACRGWLIVGRLDNAPASAPAPSTATGPADGSGVLRVRSAAEAADVASMLQTPLLGQPILVDGTIALDAARTCAVTDDWCVLGHLDRTAMPVFATGYTSALIPTDAGFTTSGVMAFVVETSGLQYLGYMGYHDGASFEFPIAALTDLTQQPRGPMVAAVSGWLVAGPPVPCPAPAPGTPPNTPFAACPGAYLLQDSASPWFWNGDQVGFRQPQGAIAVQYGAYFDFAPSPATGAGGPIEPRYGTYLVRLVTNTGQPEATAPRGWQVVARLDPAPVVGPPLPAPLPSVSPVEPTAAPSGIPTICIPDGGLAATGITPDGCASAITAALASVANMTAATVTRLYLQPGYFLCGEHFVESATCQGAAGAPGSRMYGWAALAGTDQVVPLQLWRTPPTAVVPDPSWQVTVWGPETPPAGWTMPTATPAPSPTVSPEVTCVPEVVQPGWDFGGDPCPSAISAALTAAAARLLPVTRLYLAPGIFPCGKLWGEPATCFGQLIVPGAAMHGWVAFDGTNKVAAVALRREPPTASTPQPPWTASIEAFEVPPAGWSMP